MKKENFFKLILKVFSSTGHKTASKKTKTSFKKNIWGASGRKAQMDMRSLLQMKPFTSSSKFSK